MQALFGMRHLTQSQVEVIKVSRVTRVKIELNLSISFLDKEYFHVGKLVAIIDRKLLNYILLLETYSTDILKEIYDI